MRQSYGTRKVLRHHRRPSELQLVSMIDIFTVLVTFLLMTAVFSRTVIVELKLPTQSSTPPELPPALELEIILRKDLVQVADRATGPMKTFQRVGEGYDLQGLSEFLQIVKNRFQEKTDATMLLEPDIPYDQLVQVMDHVRVVEVRQSDNQLVQAELFPNISIGDAPAADAAAAAAAAATVNPAPPAPAPADAAPR